MASERNLAEEKLKLMGAQAGQEATRRLQMLTRKYNLSTEQQELVFPVVARASPAYGQMSSLAGESLADAYVDQPDSFPLPEVPTSTDLAQTGPTESGPTGQATKPPVKTKAFPKPADDETPPIVPLDDLEPQLAPFLNPDQLAKMDEEQIDRYYWWGEILLQLNGDIEADAARRFRGAGFSTGTSSRRRRQGRNPMRFPPPIRAAIFLICSTARLGTSALGWRPARHTLRR